jgi:hypothetical protein
VRQVNDQCATNQFLQNLLNLSLGSLDAIIPSANGDRQILPKQTIKIFIGMMLYSVNFGGYLQQIS